MFQIVKDEVIKPAFAELRKKGYIARMNIMCCGSCMSAELSYMANEKGKKGYLGWHKQDNDDAKYGYIYIGFGLVKDGPFQDPVQTIGKDIVQELMVQANKWNADVGNREVWVDWNWLAGSRIKLAWRMQ